ncbi:ABC transporter permease [Halobacteriovorax sp. HLS]|uniref:ABC transporter permease n=1 Tax=Halobacteriovorax sp. HLS TaxID=2234000 RepID=UPI0013E2A61F|nr:ABC transporter permease [Halobacteriovorax sp. HLS]
MNRIKVLLKKEFFDFINHPQTFVIFFVVIVINFFLAKSIGTIQLEMYLTMSIVMIGFYSPSFLFTEEIEKRTLDALLLTPVSAFEIIFSKALFYTLLSTLVSVFLTLSFDASKYNILTVFFAVTLGSLWVTLLGIIIGSLCKKQSEISGYGTIIFLVLFLPNLLAPINDGLNLVSLGLPTRYVTELIHSPVGSKRFFEFFLALVLQVILLLFLNLEGIKRIQSGVENLKRVRFKEYIIVFLVLLLSFSSAHYFQSLRGGHITIDTKKYYKIQKLNVSFLLDSPNLEVEEMDLFGEKVISISDSTIENISIKVRIKERVEAKTLSKWYEEKNVALSEKKSFVVSRSLSDDNFTYEVENRRGKYWSFNFFRGHQQVSIVLSVSSSIKISDHEHMRNLWRNMCDSRLNSIKSKSKIK